MKINRDMVDDLNRLLHESGYCVTLEIDETRSNSQCEIVLRETKGLDSYTLNINSDLQDRLTDYFLSIGIEIKFNNTLHTFWSMGGFN